MKHWLLLTGLSWTLAAVPPGPPLVGLGRPVQAGSGWRSATGLRVGSAAPAFRLQNLAGQPVSLADFRGKVVYLDFWYSGCRPCLAEAPAAARLRRQFRHRAVVFVGISVDTQVELWRRTVAEHALDGPGTVHLLDPEGYRAVRPYGIQGYPTYWIIGRDGRIWYGDAPRPSEEPQQLLAQALAARP